MKVFQHPLYRLSCYKWVTLIMVLSAIILLVACNRSDGPVIVVTKVVLVEGSDQIVTRLVQQTVPVTMTPESEQPPNQLIELDLRFPSGKPDIDPQKTGEQNGIDLVENIFAGLTNFNNSSNQVEPELAKSWQISEDGRTWQFNLRDDIFWVTAAPNSPLAGDEVPFEVIRPVSARDLVYSIQRACARQTGLPDAFVLFVIENCEKVYGTNNPSTADLDQIGIRALNENLLEIKLTEPSAQFLTLTSLWYFHPVPQELVDEFGPDWTTNDVQWYSGPFVRISDPNSDSQTILQRNPFWPLSRQGNVDKVNILHIENDMNAFQLWQAKGLDITSLPSEVRESFLTSTPQKANLVTNQTVFYLGFNFNSRVFREPEVRRAFSAAIDRNRLIEEVWGGQAIPMRHLIPPGAFGALDVDEVGVGYNPDFARLQLAESGFRNCRLLPPITLLVNSSDLSLQQAELIRQMWVDELECQTDQIEIEQVQFGTLLSNTRQDARENRPDMWELGWASYYPDGHNWFGDLIHCTESENRMARPCGPVDDLISEAKQTVVPEQRQALFRQVENLLFAEDGIQPLIPLYVRGDFVAVQSWLTYQPSQFGGEQYDTYLIEADLKRLERSR